MILAKLLSLDCFKGWRKPSPDPFDLIEGDHYFLARLYSENAKIFMDNGLDCHRTGVRRKMDYVADIDPLLRASDEKGINAFYREWWANGCIVEGWKAKWTANGFVQIEGHEWWA